jgi:hypothetical protein
MVNNNVLEEYFIWEENNSTDLNRNLLKNVEQDNSVTTIETKTDSMPNDWRDITDPKLRNKAYKKAWENDNKQKIKLQKKLYWESNKSKLQEYNKNYCQINKNELHLKSKIYREVNRDEILIKKKIYYKSNKSKINQYYKKKKNTDLQFKLCTTLRSRLRLALKNNQKVGSAVKDLGCTIDELKSYLESKFQNGMTWDNWSLYGWHIDHIKPLASFDLSDRKQLLEACHYTNLQPLWAKDNLAKSDN